MVKQHRSHKRRANSHKVMKSRTMRLKGGGLAGNPPSAWGWTMGTLGNGWTQFMNSLTLQPGQNLGTIQSNDIVPVGDVNAQDAAQGMIGANMKGDIPTKLVGGEKRRRHRRSRAKRGGNVLAQAAVPLTLIAMNNALGSRRRRRH